MSLNRRNFLHGFLLSGAAFTVSGCKVSKAAPSALAPANPTTTAPPAPAPAAPPAAAVPSLNNVSIDQAEQGIRSLFTEDLAWGARQRRLATDVIARSPAEFQTAVNALFDAAVNPSLASQDHRIQCAWNGSASLPGAADARITIGRPRSTLSHLASGGSLTVSAASGFSPAFANTVFIGAQGVIVEGIGFTRSPAAGELPAAVSGVIPVCGDVYFPLEPVIYFRNCYFGDPAGFGSMRTYSSEGLPAPDGTRVGNGLSTQGLSRYLSFEGCRFWGVLNALKPVSRGVRVDQCDFAQMSLDGIDLFGHKFLPGYTAAAWISQCTFRDTIDTFENRSQHVDAIQYCGPMDIHQGIRLLVTDCVAHLGHSFGGDPGMGGGSQGLHGAWNTTLDNQFVIRRSTFLVTAPHGFAYYSPRASRPSFVDSCTFTRAGRTPSGFTPCTRPQEDFVAGITIEDNAMPSGGDWLLVSNTIAWNHYRGTGAIIDTVGVDPRNIAAPALRPETVFAGRDFARGGAPANHIGGKFAYDLRAERQTQRAFVAGVWDNFAPTAAHVGKGAPDLRGLAWKA